MKRILSLWLATLFLLTSTTAQAVVMVGFGQSSSTPALVSDTFDGTGALSSDWTAFGAGTPTIVSGEVKATVNNTSSRAKWIGTFADNQYAKVTLTANSVAYSGALCRMNGSNNGYGAICNTSTTCQLYKLTAGSATSLKSAVTVSSVVGKVIKIGCSGSTITGYIDDVSFDSTTDTSYTSGTPGITVYSNVSGSITAFEGGDL